MFVLPYTVLAPEGLKFDLDTCRCMLDEHRAGESMKTYAVGRFQNGRHSRWPSEIWLKKKVIYSHI